MSSEPHRVFYEPMRNLPIDPVRNPIEPIRKKVDTNWCQRRMYIMDQSFPNPQINSITRDSDIFHWFQFLKLTDQEKNSQVQKIEKLSKMLFFAMFTGKRHFYKRVYECVTASILLLIRILSVNYSIITRYLGRRHV